MKILIVGGGNMGKTYAQSFLNAKVATRDDLNILDKDKLKIDLLNSYNLGKAYSQPGEWIREMDMIILAVKPQDTAALYPILKPYMRQDQLVLSIMAGIKISDIQSNLGVSKVVRAMPNLPAQMGMGMTVFTASDKVPSGDLALTKLLLDTTGLSMSVEKEDMLNAATAISGSGPAYVFYFLDCLIQSAIEMGFSPAEARTLAEQTFLGSTQLYKNHTLSCTQWIDKVASRGGTTESALSVFNGKAVSEAIKEGIQMALERSRELSAVKE
jgi:pyrroline-5-carboxylate reductase